MTHIWFWKTRLPDRKGQSCKVLARGALNSIMVEFADGFRVITSRYAVRLKASSPKTLAPPPASSMRGNAGIIPPPSGAPFAPATPPHSATSHSAYSRTYAASHYSAIAANPPSPETLATSPLSSTAPLSPPASRILHPASRIAATPPPPPAHPPLAAAASSPSSPSPRLSAPLGSPAPISAAPAPPACIRRRGRWPHTASSAAH